MPRPEPKAPSPSARCKEEEEEAPRRREPQNDISHSARKPGVVGAPPASGARQTLAETCKVCGFSPPAAEAQPTLPYAECDMDCVMVLALGCAASSRWYLSTEPIPTQRTTGSVPT